MSHAILLVDDCEIVIESVRRLLERDGYEVVVASNCHEARDTAIDRQFSAHVIDLELLDCRGVDLALWLKSSGHHAATIFHTGHPLDSPAVELAQKVGHVVMKASGSNNLLQVLRSVIERGSATSLAPSSRPKRSSPRLRSRSTGEAQQIANSQLELVCAIRPPSRTPPR